MAPSALGGSGARTADLQHDVGGHRDPGLDQDGPHVGLVHGHLQGLQSGPDDDAVLDEGSDDGQIHLLVVERDHVDPIGQRAQMSASTRGEPSSTSDATAQAASSGLSASTATERPRALSASAAMRANCPAPTTPTWWALRSLASARSVIRTRPAH